MYALVDCNNFYASCERVFRPELIGKPVIILSNNDGCTIARSNEAKALGIKMTQPAFQIKDIITNNNVAVFSSNYTLYGDMSQRVIDTLKSFVSALEVYSIDESFLDLTGFEYYNLPEYCQKIRRTVHKNTGIPVCVGVAKTKTLAKVANRIAKKNTAFNGVCILNDPAQIEEALKKFDVEDIWGVGYQFNKLLKSNNINNAWDLRNADRSWVKKHMSIVGVRIQEELMGKSCIELESVRPAKQAICTSRSFGTMIEDKNVLAEAVSNFAVRCAYKLRQQKSAAAIITVFIWTNRFKESEQQYYGTKTLTLPVPTNDNMELIKFSNIAMNQIFKPGYRYKKAGVIVTGIVNENQVQSNLFDVVDREKQKKIMDTVDKINDSMGRDKIKLGAQGTGKKWKLRQEKLSPSYTTKWSDIIVVNAK